MLGLHPPLVALLPHSAGPYVALMLIGFVVGIAGHLTRIRLLVAVGVVLIFLGALLFPLLTDVTGNHAAPIQEPRGDFGE